MVSERFYISSKFYDLTATIANGQSESAAIDLNGLELAGIFIPASFDGASLSLKAAPATDGTYVTVQDGAGADFTLPTTAGRYAPISNLAITVGLRFIKLVSASPQATTDTVFTLAARSV